MINPNDSRFLPCTPDMEVPYLSNHGWYYVKGYLNTRIEGSVTIGENAQVYGRALVYGNAQVYDRARVCGNAQVYDRAQVCGNAWVYGNAQVCGNARVFDNARVSENTPEVKKVTMTEVEKQFGCKVKIVEPSHTIVIDGQEIELSEESFQALKKTLT